MKHSVNGFDEIGEGAKQIAWNVFRVEILAEEQSATV